MITVLILCSIAGAVLMAGTEAEAYSKHKVLNHYLLGATRLLSATMLIIWMEESLLNLILMAGVFAPTHRTALNLIRIHLYDTPIQWCHLGTQSLYDRTWVWFTTQIRVTNNEVRFILLCVLELLVAGGIYEQLQTA